MKANVTVFLMVGLIFPIGAAAEISFSEDRVAAFDALDESTQTTFAQVETLPDVGVEPQLINGTPVDGRFFPAVFRMTTGGTCTAAVVGPAAVLLAAHCVDHMSRIAFTAGGSSIVGICEQARGYQLGDDSQDWAMCLLEREIDGLVFESVDISNIPANDSTLMLTGYGCTVRDGAIDGQLRIGISTVVDKPEAWPDETSTIYTMSDLDAGEAVLCPGDSGGPLYSFTGGITDARAIVGVNSRTTFEFGVSLFSATASEAGANFIKDWQTRHDQRICGVDLFEGCR